MARLDLPLDEPAFGSHPADVPIEVLMSMAFDAWLAEKDKYNLQPPASGKELAAFIHGHIERCGKPDCDLCFMIEMAEDEEPAERCGVPTCIPCRVGPVLRYMKRVSSDGRRDA
jgi:hypothetical protein